MDLESGRTGRHMSVSNYAGNAGAPITADSGRRRSSIAPAGAVAATQRDGVINQKDDTLRKMSVAIPNLAELSADAAAAAQLERKMGFREGAALYPKAIIFSFGISLAVIMEGYDTFLLGNFFGLQTFNRKYGNPTGKVKNGVEQYQIPPQWQTALGNGSGAAQIIGLFINGIVSERIGYRYTMMGGLFLIICFIFITFFAKNIQMLLAGYVLCGLPWGVFQTLTTTYAAEVTPVALRPYLTTYVNLCWVIGQFIASGVLKGFDSVNSEWAYRVPYAIQWIWPIPILAFTFFAPESPWWLVRHGKLDQARAALLKLTNVKKNTEFNVEDTLAMMIHTNEMEIQQTSGTSYWDCFKGVDLRRTELTVVTWVMQQTSGSAMIGWAIYFFEQAGLSDSNAYSLGLAQTAFGAIGTIGSWFLMPHFGRRTLYLWGQCVMFIILIILGGLGVPAPGGNAGLGWGSGGLIMLLTFVYDFTVGPVCYCLVAELPSTRLRIKTVVLSRNVYNVCGIIIGIIQPRMLNPESWNWRGKTNFFWAGTCLLGIVWTYFRLPEPKGLTFAELDILFENKISARKFRDVEIDPYRSDNLVVVPEDEASSHEITEKKY